MAQLVIKTGAAPANPASGYVSLYSTTANDLFFKNASGTVTQLVPAAGGTPGGATTQIQFNNAGAFGASQYFSWNSATGTFKINVNPAYDYLTVASPGDIEINAAAHNSNGLGGSIYMTAGAGGLTSGSGGDVVIAGGYPFTSGSGGGVYISGTGGNGTDMSGGSVTITAGTRTGTGTAGSIKLVIPATGDLQINSAAGTVGQVLTSGGSGVAPTWATPGGASPGGSDTRIQFNDAGSFGGAAGFTWNKTTNVLTLGRPGSGNLFILTQTPLTTSELPGYVVVKGDNNTDGGGTSVYLQGGNGIKAGSYAYGGSVQISAGSGVALTGNGGAGDISINAGNVTTGTGDAGFAGKVSIYSGRGVGAGGNVTGGLVDIYCGNGNGTSRGGNLQLTGGNGGSGGARGGDVLVKPGTPGGAVSNGYGYACLGRSGTELGTTSNGGWPCIPAVVGAPTISPTSIPSGYAPIMVDTNVGRLYIWDGLSWRYVNLI